jgi:hypothetical protein
LPPLSKKLLKDLRRLPCQDAAYRHRVMIEPRLCQYVDYTAASSCFGVSRPEYDARYARMQYGTNAHGTGLKRYEKLAPS